MFFSWNRKREGLARQGVMCVRVSTLERGAGCVRAPPARAVQEARTSCDQLERDGRTCIQHLSQVRVCVLRLGWMGGGSRAARGGRIHRAACGTPARVALTELLELTARVSWLQEYSSKPLADQPSSSQAPLAGASCDCTTWESSRPCFCVTLGSGGATLSCPSFTGAPLRAWVGHTAIAAGCSQLPVDTCLASVGVWHLWEC